MISTHTNNNNNYYNYYYYYYYCYSDSNNIFKATKRTHERDID